MTRQPVLSASGYALSIRSGRKYRWIWVVHYLPQENTGLNFELITAQMTCSARQTSFSFGNGGLCSYTREVIRKNTTQRGGIAFLAFAGGRRGWPTEKISAGRNSNSSLALLSGSKPF
jgi:hypothetical protein